MYYYRGDVVPDKDAVYRVEVYHPDYASILAETYVPDDIVLYNTTRHILAYDIILYVCILYII